MNKRKLTVMVTLVDPGPHGIVLWQRAVTTLQGLPAGEAKMIARGALKGARAYLTAAAGMDTARR